MLSLGTFCALMALFHWAVAVAGTLLVAFLAVRLACPFRSRISARYSRLCELVPFAVTSDAIGRRMQIAVVGDYVLMCWVDEADQHIKILDIHASDR
jgi:hypothetical protein